MYDVIALGEMLIDFAPHSVNESGYPVLSANPGDVYVLFSIFQVYLE